MTTRYVPGPAIDEPIAMVTVSGGAKEYFHANKQGSIIAMSDGSGARVEGPYTYDSFGNCFSGGSACTSSGEPYRFTGRRFDAETGLYYYRARYYWPIGGRFMQVDPVGYTADLDLYTYVGNDPTDRTDATGTCPPVVHGCAGGYGDLEGCSGPCPMQKDQKEREESRQRRNENAGTRVAAVYPMRVEPDPLRAWGTSPWVLESRSVTVGAPTHAMDPDNLLKKYPVTPDQRTSMAATIVTILNGAGSPLERAALAALTPHPYENRIDTKTGAVLPGKPGAGGYTTYDVVGGGAGRGKWRVVTNNKTGQAYFTNTHYQSFVPINVYVDIP
jgi:RHS repeat-associated protein